MSLPVYLVRNDISLMSVSGTRVLGDENI